MKIIQHALENWPSDCARLSAEVRAEGPRFYGESTYTSLGL
jgi:hypothetical protein